MKRRHDSKFWLLMTALAVVGGASVVGFKFSSLNQDKAHVTALQQQTQDEKSVQAQLAKSQQDLDTAKEALTHLEQGVPSTAYVPTLLQQLQKTGLDSGIAVTGVRPSPKQNSQPAAAPADGSQTLAKPAYDELDIDVKGRGDYAAAMKFIKALETFPKIVGVRTIEIVPCTEPGDMKLGLVDITVGLSAYLFHDSASDTASADKKGDASASAGAAAPKAGASNAAASASGNAKPVATTPTATAKPDAKATTNAKGKGATA